MKRSWTPMVRAAAVGALALAMAAACSGQQTPATPGEKIQLKIAFWGDFGLDELEKQYEAANTNVDIVLNTGEYNAQHDALQQALLAGSGAADIAAIDEGKIVQFRSQADKFVNLLDKGAGSRQATTWRGSGTRPPRPTAR